VCRLAVGIGNPRALKGAFLLMAQGENTSMMEFLDAVARLELSLQSSVTRLTMSVNRVFISASFH
jgi:hypothetical protein